MVFERGLALPPFTVRFCLIVLLAKLINAVADSLHRKHASSFQCRTKASFSWTPAALALARRDSNIGVMNLVISASLFVFVLFAAPIFADGEGSIHFYLDTACSKSAGDPLSIRLGNCTDGSYDYLGVEAASFPPCDNGQATLEISDVASCQPSSFQPPIKTTSTKFCLSLPNLFGIASAGFKCDGEESSNQETTRPNPIVSTSSTASIASSSSEPSTSDTSGPPRKSGYSASDVIALGVGLGIGLPSFLVTAFVCFFGTDFFRRALDLPPPYTP